MDNKRNKRRHNTVARPAPRADALRVDPAAPIAASPPTTAPPGAARPQSAFSQAILRDWKRIALITMVATLFAWILSSMQPPRYQATALAAVAPLQDGLQASDYLRGLEVLERRTVVTTVAALATSATTRAQVDAGSDYEVRANVVPNTNLFSIDVEGSSPTAAASVANRIAQLMSVQTRAMYQYYSVRTVAPAVPSTAPIAARPVRSLAAGPIVGLLLGLLAATATHWRSTRHGRAA